MQLLSLRKMRAMGTFVRRAFNLLALAATLALAAVPGAGRLLGQHANASGAAHVAAHAPGGASLPSRDITSPTRHAGHDCGYCPLLAGLALPTPVRGVAFAAVAFDRPRGAQDRTFAQSVSGPGLGARGPPDGS